MEYLRLKKYPGAKTTMIPDIGSVFLKSGLRLFIDVFGGSGVVLLNVRSPEKVYNDLDADMFNLFRVLQKSPDTLYKGLYDSVHNGDLSRPELKRRAREKPVKGARPEARKETDPFGLALRTLKDGMLSFGGMGDTYNTREKSVHAYALKTLQQFPAIQRDVKSWKIENLDFRELIRKYDSANSFFYLDPPYFGKRWYNHNFRISDYEDLNDIMKTMKGRYLMTIDAMQDEMEEVFDTPDFIKRYENQNARVDARPPRLKAFYTNV